MSWLLPEVRLPVGRVRTVRPLDMRGSGALEEGSTTKQPTSSPKQASATLDKTPTAQEDAAAPAPVEDHHEEEPMKDKKPVIERVFEVLQKHGACTLEQIAQHADTSVANLYNYMGTLKKKHGVVKTYPDGKGSIATYSIGEPKAKKSERKPAKRAKGKAPRPATPPKPPAQPKRTNGHAAFAINEDGQLGIEKDGTKLSLDGMEFERLRGFIERTEPVWKGA